MSDSASKSDDDKKYQYGSSGDPGATTLGGESLNVRLIQALLEKNTISPAQAQLLLADQEVTGMAIDEIVLARGWITEAQLDQIVPWRKQQAPAEKETLRVSAGSKNYQQNFKQYRTLMENILGLSWD